MADVAGLNTLQSAIQSAIDSAEAETSKNPQFVAFGLVTIDKFRGVGEFTILYTNHNEPPENGEHDNRYWVATTPLGIELLMDDAIDLAAFITSHIGHCVRYQAERWNMPAAEVLAGLEFYPRGHPHGPKYLWPVPPKITAAQHDEPPSPHMPTMNYPPELDAMAAEWDRGSDLRNWMRVLVRQATLPTRNDMAKLDELLAAANNVDK